MGIGPFKRISSAWPVNQEAKIPEGNPDPKNYKIVRHHANHNYLLVEIQYPDCKNYEGRKILLYTGITLDILKRQTELDPHFSNAEKGIYPIARFVPTEKGWSMASHFMRISSHFLSSLFPN